MLSNCHPILDLKEKWTQNNWGQILTGSIWPILSKLLEIQCKNHNFRSVLDLDVTCNATIVCLFFRRSCEDPGMCCEGRNYYSSLAWGWVDNDVISGGTAPLISYTAYTVGAVAATALMSHKPSKPIAHSEVWHFYSKNTHSVCVCVFVCPPLTRGL